MKHNTVEGVGGVKSMKVSVKYKVLGYSIMNFSTLFFSATAAIQGRMSIQWGLIIYLASALWINLLVWVWFRMKDKGSL
jgi:hypothetical protein